MQKPLYLVVLLNIYDINVNILYSGTNIYFSKDDLIQDLDDIQGWPRLKIIYLWVSSVRFNKTESIITYKIKVYGVSNTR